MPIFTIKTPEGKKLRIRADTEQAALTGAQQWHPQHGATSNLGFVGESVRAFKGGVCRPEVSRPALCTCVASCETARKLHHDL